uniref:Uncharacterized protein n=1 Tax=Anguilla anguilla TaxID=7936 RepID=A0A0E9VHC0_ANGAN
MFASNVVIGQFSPSKTIFPYCTVLPVTSVTWH